MYDKETTDFYLMDENGRYDLRVVAQELLEKGDIRLAKKLREIHDNMEFSSAKYITPQPA